MANHDGNKSKLLKLYPQYTPKCKYTTVKFNFKINKIKN